MTQLLYANCAGIDVHKKFLMVCRVHHDDAGQVHKELRKVPTMLEDLRALATWLAETHTTHVVMESTGVYWQPVYNVLEEAFTVWLVNAKHVKNVPGRKTDVKDSEWLAQLLGAGLLQPSFIPDRPQRELRELVRYRLSLVDERSRTANRIQKVLEDANLKLGAVATDIQGKSAQAMLEAIVAGATDPAALAELARGRMRSKIGELERALSGQVREHHRFLLGQLLRHLQFIDSEIAELDTRIDEELAALPALADQIPALDTIPGVDRQAAITIVAEIGADMSRFGSAARLCAWAGMVPGNNETGGKARPAATRKGNRHLRRILVQAAHAAAHKKESYLRAQYYRLARRRGTGRAAVAVGHSILEIVYYLITRGTTYQELGAEYLEQRNSTARIRYLTRELEKLNLKVTVEPVGQAA
jgi:transposase